MTTLGLEKTLQTLKKRQSMLKDIDSDTPDAELVAEGQKRS